MNTDFPTDPREALEASLTALLLGELPADQAVFVREAIARDPELARRYERLKQTIELVRTTAKTPAEESPHPSAALKLSQERREQLMQHFKTVSPKEFKPTRRSINSWLVPLSVAALLMAVCGGLLLPALSRSKSRGMAAYHSASFGVSEERELLRARKGPAGDSEKVLAGVPLKPEEKPPVVVAAQQVEVATASPQIVLPAGSESHMDQDFTYYRSPVPSLSSAIGPMSYDSGGGGLGGGVGGGSWSLSTQAYTPLQTEAMRRSYGGSYALQNNRAINAAGNALSLGINENPISIDPVTGLPLQAGKPVESITAGPPASIDRYGLAVNTAGLTPADAGAVVAFGGRAGDSNGMPWSGSATLGGFYDSRTGLALPGAPLPTDSPTREAGQIELAEKKPSVTTGLNAASEFKQPLGEVPQMLASAETLRRVEELRDQAKTDLARNERIIDDNSRKKKEEVLIATNFLARTDALRQGLVELDKQIKDAKAQDAAKLNEKSLAQLQVEKFADYDNDGVLAKPQSSPPIPQPEILTRENAFSTFSLNVSDVSFKLAAASLEKGTMPDPAGIRVEEFINAFDYRDPEPAPGVPIAFACERAQYPFAQNRDLLRFSLKTAAQGRQPGRPLNLVLLLDNSGSMERADRVQIIREALRVLAAQLQPQDTFSVVTFARTAHLRVDGIPGNQAGKAAEEISGLTPQGGTNLEEAMNLAYQTALRHYLPNGVNRVVLLTDGAANLGNVDPESLKQKVEANRKQGIALDGFGIGWEGYNDDLLEVLTRNGDGRYGFINTPEEAATGFANQLAGALHVAAADVKVQVEFNPNRVTAFRQIGYAKHQLTKEQFRDNTVDAAEIGAAESGNALYVVQVNPNGQGPLATVRVRYKVPGTTEFHEHEWPVPYTGAAVPLQQSSPALRLSASAAGFGEWLSTSPYAAEVTPDALLGILNGIPEVYGADTRPKTLEWMLRQAKSITGK